MDNDAPLSGSERKKEKETHKEKEDERDGRRRRDSVGQKDTRFPSLIIKSSDSFTLYYTDSKLSRPNRSAVHPNYMDFLNKPPTRQRGAQGMLITR